MNTGIQNDISMEGIVDINDDETLKIQLLLKK